MFQVLQQIDKLLAEIELKISRITGESHGKAVAGGPSALTSLKKLEGVALRYIALAQKIGIPAEAERVIQLGAQMLVLMRMMQMSMMSMAGGPLGIAMGAAGMMLAGLSAASMLEGY